jgi:phosphatidylglycerophosphate synthase
MRPLIRMWRLWCAAGAAGILLTGAVLAPAFGGRIHSWLVLNLAAFAAIMALVRRDLPLNRRRPDGPLLPVFGPGTHLTLLRGVLLAQLCGYLLYPWPAGEWAWLPAITYSVALLADGLDGYAARRTGVETQLGSRLDIELDGLGVLLAAGLAVHYGRLPWIYLVTVGSARYWYLLAGWMMQRSGKPPRPLTASGARRTLAGAVMMLEAAALWPIAPSALISFAAVLIGLPFLVGLTRDILVLVGRVDPESAAYRRATESLATLATVVLPPFLRAALLLLLGPLLVTAWTGGAGGPASWVVLVLAGGLALVVLGIAGRLAAAGMVIVLGLTMASEGVTPRGLAVWGLCIMLVFLGTGAASLARPDAFLFDPEVGRTRR